MNKSDRPSSHANISQSNNVWEALKKSPFRQRFQLTATDRRYLADRTLATVMQHAEQFLGERLAPARPAKDGRQTPMRGHPVFVAQHATATCCRQCLSRWHGIPLGRPLSDAEVTRVLDVIRTWLEGQLDTHVVAEPHQRRLFD